MTNNPWDNDSKNPWGDNNKNQPHKKNNNNQPPNLDEFFNDFQQKFKNIMPSGNGWVVGLFGVVAVVGWLSTGFYRVKTGEQGIVLQFGKYLKTTSSGLNYHLPYPIQQKIIVDMELNRNISVGKSRPVKNNQNYLQSVSFPTEETHQMLTGDENILTIDFDVRWKVSNASDYLFKVNDPEQTVGAVSESVMREVVGRKPIDAILTTDRDAIADLVRQDIQKTLDDYKAGIRILQVAINAALPPEEVIAYFKDVQAAIQDSERAVEEANAYAAKILPKARGEAVQELEKASGYKESVIAKATGETSRFEKIHEEYSKAPEVTKKRIYLETVEKILSDKNKLILSKDANKSGVLPYLPLDSLTKKSSKDGVIQ
jgi:membrane protease subunit HflK